MRRVVVSEFVSLDGVMEDPGGAEDFAHGGWTFRFPDPEQLQYKLDEVFASDALLLGRVTYEAFAEAWPSRSDEAGFADQMNNMAKYVVSTTLEEADWNNSTVIRGNIPKEVAKLKQQPGKDILVAGSCQLARTLFEHNLVDEYRLMVFPIVLGSGKRLFGDASEAKVLKLVDTKALASGTMIVTYHPIAEDGEDSTPTPAEPPA